MTENYMIVIEAVVGDTYYSDFAVDDVIILSGVCANDTGKLLLAKSMIQFLSYLFIVLSSFKHCKFVLHEVNEIIFYNYHIIFILNDNNYMTKS